MNDLRWGRRAFLKRACKALPVRAFWLSCLKRVSAENTPQKVPKRATGALAVRHTSAVLLNVRTMGAKGDGSTKDTLALQQALDRCVLLGGGEVVVPAGDYLTGALTIRSNTTLRLEEGASLLGSPDIADYPSPRCGGKAAGSKDMARSSLHKTRRTSSLPARARSLPAPRSKAASAMQMVPRWCTRVLPRERGLPTLMGPRTWQDRTSCAIPPCWSSLAARTCLLKMCLRRATTCGPPSGLL